MNKYIIIIGVLLSAAVVNFANAGVRFITDEGERETFKSKCSASYITCQSPKEGVGTACDGKYLSCQCPSTYQACESPKTGGSAVSCDGKFLSSDCKCPSEYDSLCSGANSSVKTGAISCDGKYKSTDCKCPSGWVTSCASPKVLSGGTCTVSEIDLLIVRSVTYRESCECPSNYVTCSNGGDTGASSCADSSGTKYTSCMADACPSGTVDVNTYFDGKLAYFTNVSSAQTVGTKKCMALPTCESFGFSSSLSCTQFIRCPFDLSKGWCPK